MFAYVKSSNISTKKKKYESFVQAGAHTTLCVALPLTPVVL